MFLTPHEVKYAWDTAHQNKDGSPFKSNGLADMAPRHALRVALIHLLTPHTKGEGENQITQIEYRAGEVYLRPEERVTLKALLDRSWATEEGDIVYPLLAKLDQDGWQKPEAVAHAANGIGPRGAEA